ncbi:MAG: YihY/virulence factor BrkB family protein [Bacteroidota bacterium]
MDKVKTSYRGKLLQSAEIPNDYPAEDPLLDIGAIERQTSESQPSHPLFKYLQTIKPKGFGGESLYTVGRYFLRAMFMENLNMRASSLSFYFFLALFPALIFLLTLIAYLPITGLKTQFIRELSLIMPEQTYKEIRSTILEILNKQNSGLLSFGFITTLYFASNAFHLLINSFNRRLPNVKKKNWFQIRGRAVFMTFWVSILIILGLFLITMAYQSVLFIQSHRWPLSDIYTFIITIFEYLVLIALFLIGISSLYFFGPANQRRWKFFTAGSTTATVLSALSSWGFALYVNNFNTYNKVYGSIGAIIALMILIYINILTIIVGFELNVSIEKALNITNQRNATNPN